MVLWDGWEVYDGRSPPALVPIQPRRDYSYQAGPVDTRRVYGPPESQPSWADQVEYYERLDLANYQQWLMETGLQPNYLPPLWTKPRARPNAKHRAKLREVCKRCWEGGQADYEPHSNDPYYHEGSEYGTYEEPYAEDDYGRLSRSPPRQERRTPLPQWSEASLSGEPGRHLWL